MSDSNLIVRMLREQRDQLQAFRAEVRGQFADVTARLVLLENTISGMASHLFALTGTVKEHSRRIRKLEARPGK